MALYKFDIIDYLILFLLNKNGRMRGSEISAISGVNDRTVRKRIEGLIEMEAGRYAFLIDPAFFGYNITCDVFIEVEKPEEQNILGNLMSRNNIIFLGHDFGNTKISIEVIYDTRNAFFSFLNKDLRCLKGVKKISYAFVPEVLKTTAEWVPNKQDFLSSSNKIELRNVNKILENFTEDTRHKNVRVENYDYELLKILFANPKEPVYKIAEEINLDQRTVRKRIDSYQYMGLGSFRFILNPNTFGYGLKVDIFFDSDSPSKDSISYFRGIENISYIACNSEYSSISVELRVKNIDELQNFLSKTSSACAGYNLREYTLMPAILKDHDSWLPTREVFNKLIRA